MKQKFKIIITGYAVSDDKKLFKDLKAFLNNEYKKDVYVGLEEGGAEFVGIEQIKINKILITVK
jgi:hypothetical protein